MPINPFQSASGLSARLGFLRSPVSRTRSDLFLPGPGGYPVEVVGESFHMEALTAVVEEQGLDLSEYGIPRGFKFPGLSLRISPEPHNEYDRNAVGIFCPKNGLLGHLPRANAARYVNVLTRLDRRHRLWCDARVGGLFDEDCWRIGVRLNLAEPEELAAIRRASGRHRLRSARRA